jgi:phosphate ABC transporter phosphate-binding protein
MKGIKSMRLALSARLTRVSRLVFLVLSVLIALAAVQLAAVQPSSAAAGYVPIDGSGSTWVEPAMQAWAYDVQQYSMQINYTPNGSSSGRSDFADGTEDFGASEIPYGVQDGTNFDPPPSRGYAYIPDAAGGTTFMYNLNIDGVKVTNLRLSGAVIAGIFTNKITMWNDPAIKKDNPDLNLPALQIIPVVRSDGSGATAQFTQWMLATEPTYWKAYCTLVGRSPCTQTSTYPVAPNTAMTGQSGDTGVSGFVSQAAENGAIGYVEYAYALATRFPVAKVLNKAGFYTLPSPGHVAVSLLKAQINYDKSSPAYLTQNLAAVYTDPDPRTYELSSYSYLIIPTDMTNHFTDGKGNTLGAFGQFLLCVGQSQVDVLGYSALPENLVLDGYQQLQKIPGASVPATSASQLKGCSNPTFSTNGTNTLADDDPQPGACDKEGASQCPPGYQEPTEPIATVSGKGGKTPGSGSSTTSPSGGGGSPASGGTHGATPSGGGATPAPGATGSTSTAGTSGQTCDPNTGVCTPASASSGSADANGGNGSVSGSGQPVADTPITLAGSNGNGVEVMLMALAAGMLLLFSVVPPLIAQAGRRSRRRRGIDEFYDDDRGTGR